MKTLPCLAGVLLLAGCHAFSDREGDTPAGRPATTAAQDDSSLRFADAAAGQASGAQAHFVEPPVLKAQVVLDRLGFSPGVIDGKEGESFTRALAGFQEAHDLTETGRLDPATQKALAPWTKAPATRLVTIPAGFAKGPFVPELPSETSKQADFPALGYRSLVEALAERFHTTPEALVALNPKGTKVGAGRTIRVPDIADIDTAKLGKDERGWNRTLQLLGVAPDQPQGAKVVVDKSDGVLRVLDEDDRLIAQFPATMGSEHDPLPIGRWKIQGISRNPDFHFNPKLFWDVSDSKEAAMLKPGPNGPVGVVWLDLSKPHYGIHGTGEPQTIGRAESHGCVRLTNWDAARLAQMLKLGVTAVFQP
ncbi:MAG: L,D-transpeptidase family protein [Sphingobium sp.]